MPPQSPDPATPDTANLSDVSLEVQLRAASQAAYQRGIELNQKTKALQVLSDELSEANKKLSELDKLKSDLLSLTTHRLRGPLASIRGYVSMMAEGGYDGKPEEMKEVLNRIVQSTGYMDSMIGEFVLASELASDVVNFDLVAFDIADVLREVLAKMIPLAATKHIEIKSEIHSEPLTLSADIKYIIQVLSIIIDNAIHYTPEKGMVTVKLVPNADSSMIHFEVIDTGIGMSTDTVSRLFTQFVRAENAFKVWVFGSGLGLYIAKRIVDAHKGIIHAESPGEGKGSTFVVELPRLAA